MNHLLFSAEDIDALAGLPEVLAAQSRLSDSSVVQFNAELPEMLRERMAAQLDVDSLTTVPMRWIRGDTPAHVDSGDDAFERTHIIYLTDSEGEFVLDGVSHPIAKGCGFTFDHGISHETRGTGSIPRLLLGPMSERAAPVGGAPVPCFPEGTRIQTLEGYKVVETLTTTDLVATSDGRFVAPKIFKMSLRTATTDSAPYRIEAGSLSTNYPPHSLCLSPLHAVLDPTGLWHIPRAAARINAGVTQYGVGKPITYYHIECPNFYTDNLVAEGAVVESYKNRQGTKTVVYEWVEELKGFRRIPKEESFTVPAKATNLLIY